LNINISPNFIEIELQKKALIIEIELKPIQIIDCQIIVKNLKKIFVTNFITAGLKR